MWSTCWIDDECPPLSLSPILCLPAQTGATRHTYTNEISATMNFYTTEQLYSPQEAIPIRAFSDGTVSEAVILGIRTRREDTGVDHTRGVQGRRPVEVKVRVGKHIRKEPMRIK